MVDGSDRTGRASTCAGKFAAHADPGVIEPRRARAGFAYGARNGLGVTAEIGVLAWHRAGVTAVGCRADDQRIGAIVAQSQAGVVDLRDDVIVGTGHDHIANVGRHSTRACAHGACLPSGLSEHRHKIRAAAIDLGGEGERAVGGCAQVVAAVIL